MTAENDNLEIFLKELNSKVASLVGTKLDGMQEAHHAFYERTIDYLFDFGLAYSNWKITPQYGYNQLKDLCYTDLFILEVEHIQDKRFSWKRVGKITSVKFRLAFKEFEKCKSLSDYYYEIRLKTATDAAVKSSERIGQLVEDLNKENETYKNLLKEIEDLKKSKNEPGNDKV